MNPSIVNRVRTPHGEVTVSEPHYTPLSLKKSIAITLIPDDLSGWGVSLYIDADLEPQIDNQFLKLWANKAICLIK
ncbi:hypothetical protein ACWU37_21315 (plasmid) [Photobacterium damselae subsp. damselae]|uniref:hypothetical protein n=1 Tax=Photobacterium damselae TaxID=38293 RepID=UPI001F22D880|nr:hypothetical protein [Photobacterium damselae]UKA12851.1 hypothetical protein IHC91_20895 [Photobacterium damselae subsp. damselae]